MLEPDVNCVALSLEIATFSSDPTTLDVANGAAGSVMVTVQAVPGVQNVAVTRLERYEIGEPTPGETDAEEVPSSSVLTLGPLEIARLDNDPNFPENGRVSLDLRGGR